MHRYILQEKDNCNPSSSSSEFIAFQAESDSEAVRVANVTWPDWKEWACLLRVDLVEVTS